MRTVRLTVRELTATLWGSGGTESRMLRRETDNEIWWMETSERLHRLDRVAGRWAGRLVGSR